MRTNKLLWPLIAAVVACSGEGEPTQTFTGHDTPTPEPTPTFASTPTDPAIQGECETPYVIPVADLELHVETPIQID